MTDQADYPPLRPCPFCGKVPIGISPDMGDQEMAVMCHTECGAFLVFATSKAEAADKWNRRAKL